MTATPSFFVGKTILERPAIERDLIKRLLILWRAEIARVVELLKDNSTLPGAYRVEFEQRQQDIIAPWLEHLILSGVTAGKQALGIEESGIEGKAAPAVAVTVDWQLVNDNAVRWARTYSYELVSDITETTCERLQTAVGDWLEAGEAFPALTERVQAIFDDPYRAKMIAATEATRAIAEGNTQAWAAADVPEREWRTAVDRLVCPLCGALHQQRAKLGEPFPGGIANPPAHPNCRCMLAPIVKPERSPAPGVGQERRVVAGRERTFNVLPVEGTRLLIPVDLDPARQIWARETLEAAFAAERAKLPEPLRDVVPEIVVVDTRERDLEQVWEERLGLSPDAALSRVTASTNPVTGRISIYQNADLRDDPDWQGAGNDLREELGHSLAVYLFGSPNPPPSWPGAVAADGGELLGRDAAEDWAQTIVLWLTGDSLQAYPHRLAALRLYGFGTIKVIEL